MTSPTASGLAYRGVSRRYQVPPCVLTVEDLRKLFIDLNERTIAAVQKQLSKVERPPSQDPKEFERLRQETVEKSGLTMMVLGSGGEQVILNAPEAIESRVLPDAITTIVYDSSSAFQAQLNYVPLDRFKLTLDFTEPPGFNVYNPWDQPTPNNSVLEVIGATDTWVAGVHEKVRAFLDHRKRRRAWLHSAVTFTLANWFVGLPLCFWGIYRIDPWANTLTATWPTVLRGAFYIYVFLLFFLGFRVLIAALRWLFPIVELKGTRPGAARAVVGVIVLGVVSGIIYDLIKALLS